MNRKSWRCSRAIALLALASSALPLTACTTTGEVIAFQTGDARLAVDLPAVCDAFLQPVPPPAVSRKTDARAAAIMFADGLDEANTRITSAASCHRDERVFYKAKGPPK